MLSPEPVGSRTHGLDISHGNFAVKSADLIVGGVAVKDIVSKVGSPVFVYDGALMRNTYRGLATALGDSVAIHYSVKANPQPAIIRLFAEEGAGVEIASVGEYRAAVQAGVSTERILFAGPGKRRTELEEVIAGGIGEIHLESYEEIERIDAIGCTNGRRVKAAIRINPVSASQAGAMRMGGKPTAFGFDEEDLEGLLQGITRAANIDLVGVHVYGGTQILDADALTRQWRHAIDLAVRVATLLGKPLKTIDLGGGLGIPYHSGEKILDLERVAAAMPPLFSALKSSPLIAEARLIVEPGRFLVGPAGIYVASVNAVKRSRGKRFLITDGGMHHHLAASGNLGQIIKRDYPLVAPTKMDAVRLYDATVVGPLCTPLDTLAREALLPDLVSGDLIAILQSGAYGPTASPGRFLSHSPPAEVLIENGTLRSLDARSVS